MRPTSQPSRQPSSKPSGQPVLYPTSAPTRVPTSGPTGTPRDAGLSLKVGLFYACLWVVVLGGAALKEYYQSAILLREHAKMVEHDMPRSGEGKSDHDDELTPRVSAPGRVVTATTTTLLAEVGDQKLHVASIEGFEVDMYVEIGTGVNVDRARVSSFGSLVLSAPLRYHHPRGTPVVGFDVGPGDLEPQDPRAAIKESIAIFMARIFQGVFNKDAPWARRLETEVENHHLYLSLFLSRKVGSERWFRALRVLTSLTAAAMFLTLLLQFHLPYNRGTCAHLSSAALCDGPRALLDPSLRTCMWLSAQQNGLIPPSCTFNSTTSDYGYVPFVYIVLIVLFGMGIINCLLDALFNRIIAAPSLEPGARNTNLALAREASRLQLHKKVKTQLRGLQHDLLAHRRCMPRDPSHPDCLEFDSQWGIMRTPEGNMEIVLIDKMAADLYDVVSSVWQRRPLLEAAHSDVQSGSELLFLFALDLMGRQTPAARIFSHKADVHIKNDVRPVSSRVKAAAIVFVVLADAAMAYLTFFFAQKQISSWLLLDLVQFLCYLALDFVCIEGSKVFWCHVVIPAHVAPEAHRAHETILETLDQMLAEPEEEDEPLLRSSSLVPGAVDSSDVEARPGGFSRFSCSDYFFVSTRLAKSLPGLFESALVLSYRSTLPEAAGFYWGRLRKPRLSSQAQARADAQAAALAVTVASPFGLSPGPGQGQSASVRPVAGGSPEEQRAPGAPSPPLTTTMATTSKARRPARGPLPNGMQTALLEGLEPESFGKAVYRRVFWAFLRAMAASPPEVQHLACHLLQPCAIFATVNLCYVMIAYPVVSIYVVVVLAVVLVMLILLYTQFEQAITRGEGGGVNGENSKQTAARFSRSWIAGSNKVSSSVQSSSPLGSPRGSNNKNSRAHGRGHAADEDEDYEDEDDEIARHLSRLRREAARSLELAERGKRTRGDPNDYGFVNDVEAGGASSIQAHGSDSPARARLEERLGRELDAASPLLAPSPSASPARRLLSLDSRAPASLSSSRDSLRLPTKPHGSGSGSDGGGGRRGGATQPRLGRDDEDEDGDFASDGGVGGGGRKNARRARGNQERERARERPGRRSNNQEEEDAFGEDGSVEEEDWDRKGRDRGRGRGGGGGDRGSKGRELGRGRNYDEVADEEEEEDDFFDDEGQGRRRPRRDRGRGRERDRERERDRDRLSSAGSTYSHDMLGLPPGFTSSRPPSNYSTMSGGL